jgi:hypothetical protein
MSHSFVIQAAQVRGSPEKRAFIKDTLLRLENLQQTFL